MLSWDINICSEKKCKMKSKIFFLFFFITSSHFSIIAQDYIIKGIGIVTPTNSGFIELYNLGFEKKIYRQLYFDVNVSHVYKHAIEDPNGINWGLLFGLKYYFESKNKYLNNTWTSLYFKYAYFEDGDGFPDMGAPAVYLSDYRFYKCNMGLAIGKKYYLFKRKKIFIDTGIGVEYGKKIYLERNWYHYDYGTIVEEYHSLPGPFWLPYPRLILQIGYTFKSKT